MEKKPRLTETVTIDCPHALRERVLILSTFLDMSMGEVIRAALHQGEINADEFPGDSHEIHMAFAIDQPTLEQIRIDYAISNIDGWHAYLRRRIWSGL